MRKTTYLEVNLTRVTIILRIESRIGLKKSIKAAEVRPVQSIKFI